MSTFQGPVEEDSIPSSRLTMNAHFRRKIDKNPYQTCHSSPRKLKNGHSSRFRGGQTSKSGKKWVLEPSEGGDGGYLNNTLLANICPYVISSPLGGYCRK